MIKLIWTSSKLMIKNKLNKNSIIMDSIFLTPSVILKIVIASKCKYARNRIMTRIRAKMPKIMMMMIEP